MPDPVKRFPTLFGALDAIFGDAGQATQAVIAAIGPVMGADYSYERLKLLLSLTSQRCAWRCSKRLRIQQL
jgi:hypothetical protein